MPYFTQTPVGLNATETEKTAIRRAYVALRRSMISGPRAPFMGKHGKRRAAYALERARHEAAKGAGPKHNAPHIWKGLGGSDGKPFPAYGETACRWIENPESKGLRLVGFAHEVGSTYERQAVNHNGWYMDNHQHETVKGIVYRLPARGGKCRFVAGHSDPHNGDDHGNGPALVSLEVYESDATGAHYETPDAAFDAARAADGIAERMAETERNYQETYSNGSQARGLMQAATRAASKYVKTIRAFRDVWKNRHALRPDTVRQALAAIRAACDEFQETRANAHSYRDENRPAKPQPHFQPEYARELESMAAVFIEGYASPDLVANYKD